MKIKEIIRSTVIMTNSYWPFSYLNRIPYYFAIKVCILAFKQFNEIKSIYLRHGLTEENWVPGLSDIDLTVIINSKLTVEKEFSFLEKFWKNYARLKIIFPMLGEVEILNDENILSWTKFTIRGFESSCWKLLYGESLIKNNYVLNPKKLAIDSINYGLWKYRRFFLRNFYKPKSTPYLVLHDMRRLVSKVLRYAYKYTNHYNIRSINCEELRNKDDMLCCIVHGLEESIKNLGLSDNSTNLRQKTNECLNDISSRQVDFTKQIFDLSELDCLREVIESVILSRDVDFIVLKDGLDEPRMKKCVESIRQIFSKMDIMPVIVTPSIFKYIIGIYNPYIYTNLRFKRTVLLGSDLFLDIQPPDTKFFIFNLLDQYTLSLSASPQSQMVFSPSGSSRLTEPKINSIIDRLLSLKLYLEKGIVKPFYTELVAECQKYYPSYYTKIEELKLKTSKNGYGSYSIEWFRLLKDMANDVHTSLSRLKNIEAIFIT